MLAQYFPAMRWYRHASRVFCEGPVVTNSKTTYGLRVTLPDDYPSALPALTLTFPRPLRDKRRRIVGRDGGDAAMHVLGAEEDGLAICHYHPGCWSPSHTVYRVLMKGRVWLEAFECHLATGRHIDTFLSHQEP